MKTIILAVMMVFTVMMSGCVVAVPFMIAVENEANKFPGIVVEVGEVKMKAGANVAVLKTAQLSSAVFEKDMVTPNTSPRQSDAKVNATVTDEIARVLSLARNTATPIIVRLKTLYIDKTPANWYYRSVTERKTLGLYSSARIRKLINTHFILEKESDTLLEVHGLWVGDDKADEIAGAKQLARAIVAEVFKKLNAPVTEAKKD